MKRVGGLWPDITRFDNLWLAYRKARKGKANRPEVSGFALDLEGNLLRLQDELLTHDYWPGEYRLFSLYERKPRTIAAAPFRDRVVHHALMNRVEPLLDRRFISACYACRKGKGVHAAVDRYQTWARRYAYVLKLDVQRYFPTIDHAILKAKLRRLLKDPDVLWLFDTLIDSAPKSTPSPWFFAGDDLVTQMERRCGLPIGNLTSQFLGNLYLNDLDHFAKEQCGLRAYMRYVDDIFVLGDDKARLWEIYARLAEFLERERQRFHPHKAQIQRTRDGVNVLGYRVFPTRRRLRKDNGYRFRRRLRSLAKRYARFEIELSEVRCSVAAWIGHAMHADTQGLRKAVLSPLSFSRGRAKSNAGRGASRWVREERLSSGQTQPRERLAGMRGWEARPWTVNCS